MGIGMGGYGDGPGDGPLKKSYLWWRSAGYFQLSVDFSFPGILACFLMAVMRQFMAFPRD